MIATAKKQLRIPIRKPELYKPLVLILTITCLQHFSGFTFTKKFLLQILAPLKKLRGKAMVLITSKVMKITLATTLLF